MSSHEVPIQYTQGKLRAELDCPLCKQHWVFPFTAREIFGKPYPSPDQLVSLHLYGCGQDAKYCSGFDPGKPFVIENVDERTAVIRI
jgi:hypothetical protein